MSLPRRSAGFTSYLLTLYHNNAGRYGKGSATPGSSCSENPRLGIKANIMADLYSILQGPSVSLKCNGLRQRLGYFHAKDLHQFLPHLLSNIFGFDQTMGWGLRFLSNQHPDYNPAYNFLHPGGDIFNLLKKLDDKDLAYELPSHLCQSTKVSVTGCNSMDYFTRRKEHLSAFDYFFYHFAYYSGCFQSQKNPMVYVQDALYTHLFETYLDLYLPFQGAVPLPAKFLRVKENHDRLGCKPSELSLKPTLLSIHTNCKNEMYEKTPTERFIEILLEFWLDPYILQEDVLNLSQNSHIPSIETILLLRRLVKHIYYFINGTTMTSETTSQFSEVLQITDTLRRSINSSLLRKKFFQYIQGYMKYCPCDDNYRYIIELWLSYIQPWRYTDPKQVSVDGDYPVEQWKCFIWDNFPFYSTLFIDFLGRCHTFDLTTSIHVTLICRVFKVFSKNGLSDVLKRGESLLLHDTGEGVMQDSFMAASGPHSIKSSFLQCCGPEFIYTPLFNEKTVREVQKLQLNVSQCKELMSVPSRKYVITDTDDLTLSPRNKRSLFDKMTVYFSPGEYKKHNTSDDSNSKIVQMLEETSSYLLQIYELPVSLPLANESISEDFHNMTSGSESDVTDVSLLHTSKLNVKYGGDPLTQPLRSYENATLVRMLFSISMHLNTMFSSQLSAIGSSNSITSKILRPLFSNRPRVSTTPRIDLRPFGSYYNLLLLFIVFMLASLFSLSYLSITFLVLFTCLYCVLRYNMNIT